MIDHKEMGNMMTPGAVAALFNVHVNTVRKWSDREVLKSHRVGRRGDRRFSPEDVAVLYLQRAVQRLMKSC